MTRHGPPTLPNWLRWQQRPFPDANLLLLPGRATTLVDSGFVGHARETLDWVSANASGLTMVVNTHWHADHVGGNGLLQARGAGIAASTPDSKAINRRDPGACVAEYLDQPVAPYTVDRALADGEILTLGDRPWEVVATPGHTAGHLCLWQPDERLLAVGDALSDYDVGWVNLALDGPDAATTALASLQRLTALEPRVTLPAHGPIPTDTTAALTTAGRRTQRLVDDFDGAVWYAARRIFAYALMIYGGIPSGELDRYLLARDWLKDAARLLRRRPDDLATEIVKSMLHSGAIVHHGDRVHAAADHTEVAPSALANVSFPRRWPTPATPNRSTEEPRWRSAPDQ